MKYRTKLYLSFAIVALIGTIVSLSVVFYESRKLLFRELSSKVLSVAASAAVNIDGDLLPTIQTAKDMGSSAYLRIREEMDKVVDANRRKDIYVRYMFIIRPVKQGIFETVVDASRNPAIISPTGQLHKSETLNHLDEHLYEYYGPQEFMYDQYGDWLTAYAPIYDSEKKYVGTLGVDVNAKEIMAELNLLLLYGIVAYLIALIVSIILAFILSNRMTKSLGLLCVAVDKIGEGDFEHKVKLETEDEFMELGDALNHMTVELKEKEKLKRSFSRYVSEYVLDRILHSEKPLNLEGERKKITVLFSDIREFTKLSEGMPPEEVVALLNEYFEYMLDAIFRNNGTLDKFIGDGIMVEFGSPLDDPNQEKNAIFCAIDMQKALNKLLEKWQREGKPTIRMGIGIHTGEAVVGNIGTEKRMEYTAVGDTVNVAARIEAETKKLSVPILVSESTLQNAQEDFSTQDLGEVELKGRSGKIKVFSVEEKKPQ